MVRHLPASPGRPNGETSAIGAEGVRDMQRAASTGHGFRGYLLAMPRTAKRILLAGIDFCLLTFALWVAYSLRLNTAYAPQDIEETLVFWAAPIIGVLTFYAGGLYRVVTRFMSEEAGTRIFLVVGIAALVWVLFITLTGITGVPRSVVIIYGLFAAAGIRLSRQLAGWLLRSTPNAIPASFDPRKKVIIWGAGKTGRQLLRALEGNLQYKAAAFVDDDKSLWGQTIRHRRVYNPSKMARLIQRYSVKEVVLAMPAATRQQRAAVIRCLEPFPVVVRTLPALEDIAAGKVQVSDLRLIDVEDLLGRDPVAPDPELLARNIRDKTVLVTGAGGSIGSELARQILALEPAKLILFEQSETFLYDIEMQVTDTLRNLSDQAAARNAQPPHTQIVAVLGSVLDDRLVRDVIGEHQVHTIFHAAAYKHVPIVELNPVPGVYNNTLGTLVVAEAADALDVELMVLISTDKAVRPTSVMGASKRLAELALQAIAAERRTRTVFTMVRFGNVLDSSGSVVRRFRRQIENGGPVTVTHPNIIRYFMSIPEAAQLVIQAGAMATGGEVFVLDMGSPVKIDDLARTMIRLAGLEVQDEDNPGGDIPIEYIGLRQGEKLFEELLIGENTTGTKHPRIMKNSEPLLPLSQLREELEQLRAAAEIHDHEAIRAVLRRTVEDYAENGTPPPPEDKADWKPISHTLH